MTRGMDYYRNEILDGSFIDIISASNTAMMEYPLRLGRIGESSSGIASRSDRYILDSAIGDDSISNADVIDRAMDCDADWVVPCDVMQDPQKTTERIIEMFQLRDEYDTDMSILVPMQHNSETTHATHYRALSEELHRFGFSIRDEPIAVGGVKEMSPVEQARCAANLREAAGDEAYLHLLGGGFSLDWVVIVRELPWLIDGLDMSSSMQNIVKSGRLFRMDGEYVDYPSPRGKNSTVLSSMLREQQLYLLNYLMSPHIRGRDAPSISDASPEAQAFIRAVREQSPCPTCGQPQEYVDEPMISGFSGHLCVNEECPRD